MSNVQDHLRSADTVIAVVGATDDPAKFGGRIYCDLKAKGFQVRAVNPNRATVDGDISYPTLASVPDNIDIVDVVVPPHVGHSIVEQMSESGLRHLWLQPGAESQSLIEAAEAAQLDVTHHACIMIDAGNVS